MIDNSSNIPDPTYRIESQLGAGAGGVVYKAWHERLQKHVVLKRINDDASFGRDRAEADILKNLKHAHLPQVFDFLTDESGTYTVMEFIEGHSFAELLEDGQRFSQPDVVKWARQLASALAYLHGQTPPVLHSDIKPANLMLLPNGDVCLIDFNVSLVLDSEGVVSDFGTHGYASPEQYGPTGLPADVRVAPGSGSLPPIALDNAVKASDVVTEKMSARATVQLDFGEGKPTPTPAPKPLSDSERQRVKILIDARSDIYSFGATVYHLLTGEKPAIATGEIKPLSEFGLPISEAFSAIIEKCMECVPSKRFQTADALYRAIANIHKEDTRWKRQNAVKTALVGIYSFLFVAAVGTAVYGFRLMGQEIVAAYNEYVTEISIGSEDAYTSAVGLFPQKPAAYHARALYLYESGAYDEGITYIGDTMRVLSAYTWSEDDLKLIGEIYFIEGGCYFEAEDYPNAAASYEAAIKNYADNPEFYRDYAIALARCGYVARAEELLAQIQDMAIGNDSINLLKGEIAYAKGENEAAADLFRAVIAQTDNAYIKQRAYLICDRAYRRVENGTEADIVLLRAALEDLPIHYTAIIKERLADALSKGGYYEEAAGLFDELVKGGNVSFITRQNVGTLYERMGDFERARTAYESLASEFPNDYRAPLRMAYLTLAEQARLENDGRDYAETLMWYEQAVELYGKRKNGAGYDMEMLALTSAIEELRGQGWFDKEGAE